MPRQPSLAGRRVLVTGGAGFVGSHLSEELIRRGARVTIIDNLTGGRLDNIAGVAEHVEVVRLDLRDPSLPDMLARMHCDTVFHLAGHASVPDSVRDPRADFERNVVATLSLLEAARGLSEPPRLVFASSAAVYGEGASTPLREDHLTTPVAPYGASKLAAERYMDVYARVYGLRTASIRFFQIFGPRLRRHVVWDVMSKLHANGHKLSLHGDGTQIRDFMYVANAVDAFMLVAEQAPLEGEAYNAGDGSAISIADLAKVISAKMDVRPQVTYSGAVAPGVSQAWVADVTRISELGFQPRLSMDEGLDHTVAWFRGEVARQPSRRV